MDHKREHRTPPLARVTGVVRQQLSNIIQNIDMELVTKNISMAKLLIIKNRKLLRTIHPSDTTLLDFYYLPVGLLSPVIAVMLRCLSSVWMFIIVNLI